MAIPSRKIIQHLQRVYLHGIPSKPTAQNDMFSHIFTPKNNPYNKSIECPLANSSSRLLPSGFSKSNRLDSGIPSNPSFSHQIFLKPTSQNGFFSQISSRTYHSCPRSIENPSRLSPLGIGRRIFSSRSSGFNKTIWNPLGSRFFSFSSSGPGKFDVNFAKGVVDKPLSAIRSTFSRYRNAIILQVEAFFKRYSLVLVAAGGLVVCILLWRLMFGVANSVIGISEGMAKYGFLALASAIVAFSGLYIRSRFTINPDRVYRMAMRKLNTSAGILEVMGAPLSGTDLRAYIMSEGGLKLKNFKPRLSSKRCFLIFPIKGSERKGLVSIEMKKKKGQYDMKLLAVDIPMRSGPDQRLFLIGDEEEYQVGGGLISELRDPIIKAMAAQKEFDDLDEKEEEEDDKKELEEAERKQQEEIEKLEKVS